MFVLASIGPLVMIVVIIAAVLFLWVLLRQEARDAALSEEPEDPRR
jgi:hypothetical protein